MHLSVGQIHKLICTEFNIVIRECNSTRCNFYQQKILILLKIVRRLKKSNISKTTSMNLYYMEVEDLKDSEFIIINSKRFLNINGL